MLGHLSPDQIESLLQSEMVGRIGCNANGITYVVPMTYAYDGKYIYGHSREGMKIQLMRANPMVCFEVDRMEAPAKWQSVIVWGRYEELKGEERKQGLEKLLSRFSPIETSETSKPASDGHQSDYGPPKSVVFRIELMEKTGRFEHPA
jgi:hypothetical protein